MRAPFQGRKHTPVSTSNASLLSKKFKFEISLGQNGKTLLILQLSHPRSLFHILRAKFRSLGLEDRTATMIVLCNI
jgi:hypothetical protein